MPSRPSRLAVAIPRSALVGIVAVVVAVAGLVFTLTIILAATSARQGEVGWDGVTLAHNHPALLPAAVFTPLVIFVLGFWLALQSFYRRTTEK